MSIKANFPDIKPSLMLDFANTKRLDPRITFTRATTATYYDGQTVAKAEENDLLYSQIFESSTSLRETVATDNDTTAPDGTATAAEIMDVVTDSSTSNTFVKTASIPPTISGVDVTRTLSIFVKKGNYDYFFLGLFERTRNQTLGVVFDLSTNTITQTFDTGNGTVDSSSMVSVGNSWYRVSVTVTGGDRTSNEMTFGFASAATGVTIGGSYNNHGDPAYIGTGTNYVYVWGMQLEARDTVTAYTPTTTQPITNYIPVLQSAASGEARFDHDPVTGESKGLLIEEQRTNLLTRSEDISTTWTNADTTEETNVIVAPDGTLTGDKVVENTDNDSRDVRQVNTSVAGTYTLSVFAKYAGRVLRLLSLSNNNQSYVGCDFDLATGEFSNLIANGTGISATSASMTHVGNGWYRCSVTATHANQLTLVLLRPVPSVGYSAGAIYTGNGYSGIYIWGAQLEAGAFPTSYIPTVASQVTRNADAASMTGTNFSSWYRADEGTIFMDMSSKYLSDSPGSEMSISDGTNNNRIMWNVGANQQPYIAVNGSAQTSMSSGTWSVGVFQKLSIAYKFNDIATITTSGSIVTDTTALIPVVDRLSLSNGAAGSTPFDGHIRKFAYYPARLSNTELQGLTK
jgi:hypothetical protein